MHLSAVFIDHSFYSIAYSHCNQFENINGQHLYEARSENLTIYI